MPSISDQLRSKQQGAAKTAAKPAATQPSARGTRRRATKPTPTKPASPPVEKETPAAETDAPTYPDSPDTIAAYTPEQIAAVTREQRDAMSPEQLSAFKEAKKQAAFAKLKEKSAQKRVAAAKARTEQLSELKKGLKKGQELYLTRASYYGCKVKVQAIDEVRGRILVTVLVTTTKNAKRELEENEQFTRRVSPKFLQTEPPAEAYKKRRGSRPAAQEEPEAEVAEDEMPEFEDADSEELPEDDGEIEAEEGEVEDADSEVEAEEEEPEDDDSWG